MVGRKFCSGGETNFHSSSLMLMIKTRKKSWNFFLNVSQMIVFLSSLKSPGYVVLGKQADWVDLQGLPSGTLTGATWGRAVEGLGRPLPPADA